MKNIVITGASGGIGKAIALELMKDKDNRLFLISRNNSLLKNLAKEIESSEAKFVLIPFDLISDDYNKLLTEIKNITESIDILINNAGALVNKQFENILPEDYYYVMETNFRAPFFFIQHLLPLFNNNAHIVNITSMGGVQGSVKFPGLSLYSASKGALNILTECLAAEFSGKTVSFNSLALGSVETPMLAQAFPGYKPKVSSSSMAEYIAWFALNANKWMNGKIIQVALSTP
ncbi:MAG TPA: SDR family oxidoreductase [Lentimicrobium sp.]|nr:SDR family oxidoreductase [Lentimicrobium sp.]